MDDCANGGALSYRRVALLIAWWTVAESPQLCLTDSIAGQSVEGLIAISLLGTKNSVLFHTGD